MIQNQISDAGLRWLECILAERFNGHWLLNYTEMGLELSRSDSNRNLLFANEVLLGLKLFLNTPSCELWDVQNDGFKSILGKPLPAPGYNGVPTKLVEKNKDGLVVNYDIIGIVYLILSRVEEIGQNELDVHGRIQGKSSHAYKFKYLERPVVDEWLYVLGQIIERNWPNIELKITNFSVKLSHDVDIPSQNAFRGFPRSVIGALIRGKSFNKAILAAKIHISTSRKGELYPLDPFNTFEWIMSQSERFGLKSAFYFMSGHTHRNDADYQLEHPAIRNLLCKIHRRGHEIGLHPSYGSYRSPLQIVKEADLLRKICAQENIFQSVWGGRMHYLRWEHPSTLRALNDAGLAYDSTLSYADRPGFRCGTCFEYPGFDPVKNEILRIRIRPLVMMEKSVMDSEYLGLGNDAAAIEKALELKKICQIVGGTFTLLWHNSQLLSKKDRDFYLACLEN